MQGDPLSSLLFCIAEEVLSRAISKLVDEESFSLINGPKGIYVPSHINPNKSTTYTGSISIRRHNILSDLIGFSINCSLPFTNLRIPILNGRPKVAYLQPISDRIKAKLAAWK
ncbi:uncharacterized protein [Cicer arietinum]|uniref:uncharacterized protein n=1 Tax=Cicer arietinum TaxID=3827 RepID=UPI003CC56F6F